MKNPTRGTIDATTSPRTMALMVDAEYFTGLRSLYGILENDRVSMAARQKMVIFDLAGVNFENLLCIQIVFVTNSRDAVYKFVCIKSDFAVIG